MKNFWQEISKSQRPFWVLAPMEDVTDTVFRQVIARCGCPDVFFSEFVNVKGLSYEASHPEVGQIVSHRLEKTLEKTAHQKPLVAQIWGITPEDYYQSAAKIIDLGFDGIDINMGCPVKNVIAQGACSALIKNPVLASEIIQAVKEGSQNQIPVSVKTRIGFEKIETEKWAGFLLSQDLQALTIHGRTVKEESKVPCHWDEIGKVVAINNQIWKQKNVEKSLETEQNKVENQHKLELSKMVENLENSNSKPQGKTQGKLILATEKLKLFQKKTTEKSIEESQILDWYLDNFSVLLTEMDFV